MRNDRNAGLPIPIDDLKRAIAVVTGMLVSRFLENIARSWYPNLQNGFYPQNIEKILNHFRPEILTRELIGISVLLRAADDRCDGTLLRKSLKNTSIGDAERQNFGHTLRAACNKIIHCDEARFHTMHTLPPEKQFQHLVIDRNDAEWEVFAGLTGKDKGTVWLAQIGLVEFLDSAAAALDLYGGISRSRLRMSEDRTVDETPKEVDLRAPGVTKKQDTDAP